MEEFQGQISMQVIAVIDACIFGYVHAFKITKCDEPFEVRNTNSYDFVS